MCKTLLLETNLKMCINVCIYIRTYIVLDILRRLKIDLNEQYYKHVSFHQINLYCNTRSLKSTVVVYTSDLLQKSYEIQKTKLRKFWRRRWRRLKETCNKRPDISIQCPNKVRTLNTTSAAAAAAAAKSLQLCPTLCDPIAPRQPTRIPCPWDSPGKNTGVGYHFLLQCMQVKSESEVAQSCPTVSDPMECSLLGSSVHGIFQARVLEGGVMLQKISFTFLKNKKRQQSSSWIRESIPFSLCVLYI